MKNSFEICLSASQDFGFPHCQPMSWEPRKPREVPLRFKSGSGFGSELLTWVFTFLQHPFFFFLSSFSWVHQELASGTQQSRSGSLLCTSTLSPFATPWIFCNVCMQQTSLAWSLSLSPGSVNTLLLDWQKFSTCRKERSSRLNN